MQADRTVCIRPLNERVTFERPVAVADVATFLAGLRVRDIVVSSLQIHAEIDGDPSRVLQLSGSTLNGCPVQISLLRQAMPARSKRPCRFDQSATGCRLGADCDFLHGVKKG